MICPNCSALGRRSDGVCYNCHQPYPSGLRRQTLMAWCSGGCALLTFLAVFLMLPIKSLPDVGAGLCTGVCFAFAGACVGALMGYVVGYMVCEH